MKDLEKIHLYEALIGDLLVNPDEFDFIMNAFRDGYSVLAQQLVDKYAMS